MNAPQTTALAANVRLAQLGAPVVDALAEYGHLPMIGGFRVDQGGEINLTPGSGWGRDGKRALGEWARGFDATVVIDMSSAGYLRTVVPFAGREATLQMFITQREAYELGAALGIPVSPGGQVEITAEQLLSTLDTAEVGA